MRGNVRKHLPVLRKQIDQYGWPRIRKCLVNGQTKFLSRKDRCEAVRILDEENQFKMPESFEELDSAIRSGKI